MFRKTLLIAGLGLTAITAQPALARDDAVIGALIGAGVGAAIGHNVGGDRGAVLGGAIGAVTGATIVSADRDYVRTHYEPAEVYYPPRPVDRDRLYFQPREPVLVERITYPPQIVQRDWRDDPPRHRHWHRHDDRRCDHRGWRDDDDRNYRHRRWNWD